MITNKDIKKLVPGTECWVKHKFGLAVVYEHVLAPANTKIEFADLARIDSTLRRLRTIEEMG